MNCATKLQPGVKSFRWTLGGWLRAAVIAALAATAACSPSGASRDAPLSKTEWHEFEGTWTAAGSRHAMQFGGGRRASTASLEGTLLLAGTSRPGAGFRAEAIVFNDSATGMLGRAVWTDERGDQVFSELRGQGTVTGNQIDGAIVGGTGRYAGALGSYEFAWRFVLEAEDGTVQGQSLGLKGRVRVSGPGEGGMKP